jgi:hypothetical protein
MAVDPNKKHDIHQGDSEGFIASIDGNAWECILDKASVGFKEYYAWVTMQKCCDTIPAFQDTLRGIGKECKEESLLGQIVENSVASKDALEEAISKELRSLFGKAVAQPIGRMPANDKWEEWLRKHKKRLVVNVDDLTLEDLQKRRRKQPEMSQQRRMKLLFALRSGDIRIEDGEGFKDDKAEE